MSTKKTAIAFAEWLDINGIRAGQHEWTYKGDNYKGRYTTEQMFEKHQAL